MALLRLQWYHPPVSSTLLLLASSAPATLGLFSACNFFVTVRSHHLTLQCYSATVLLCYSIHIGRAIKQGQQQEKTMTAITSTTATVAGWGSDKNARRVTHLTAEERATVRAGGLVIIEGCPAVRGITTRRVIAVGRGFYARMPS